MLPPHEDVTVELVPELAGEYEFTCQMGMLRGRLIVTGDGHPRAAALGAPPAIGSGAHVVERTNGAQAADGRPGGGQVARRVRGKIRSFPLMLAGRRRRPEA